MQTIVNLAHENQLLKRRIYGNEPEHRQTSELQLSLGDLTRLASRTDSSRARACDVATAG